MDNFLINIDILFKWPYISLFSILIIFGLLLIVALLSSLVIDERKMKAYEEEIKAWEEAKRRAILKKDRKAYRKILRRESRIRHLKEEIEKMRLKSYTIAFIVWLILPNLLGEKLTRSEVVFFPLLNVKLYLFGWYLILSFWLYPLTTKIASRIARIIKGSLFRKY